MTQKLASSASSGSWLTNSLICMALYGFWGFLSKLALVKGLSASQEATIEKVGFFMLMPLVMKPSSNDSGSSSISSRPKMAILAALMSGASAAVASLFYSRAMAEGDAGAVSALTASYPPMTLMLGMAFGGETLTKNKLLGSILTVLGALFFARRGR